MEPDRSFGAVVFRSQNDMEAHKRLYLLVHQASGNHWDHPKGHPEQDETPVETAAREILEETGVSVQFLEGFFVEGTWVLPDGRPKIAGYFLGQSIGEKYSFPQLDEEIIEVKWLPYRDARMLITYDTGKKILDDAEKFISRAF